MAKRRLLGSRPLARILVSMALFGCGASAAPPDDDALSGEGGTSQGVSAPGFGAIDASASSSPPGPTRAACVKAAASGERVPVELAFVFDKSASMAFAQKFKSCASALSTFFHDSRTAGLSASLQFFPLSANDCSLPQYQKPRVEMTALPDPGPLSSALSLTLPNMPTTPTLPALQGAIGGFAIDSWSSNTVSVTAHTLIDDLQIFAVCTP